VFGNVHVKVVKLRLWQIRWPTVYLTSYSVKNTHDQLLQGAVNFHASKHLGSNLCSIHSNTLPINSNSLCDISQESLGLRTTKCTGMICSNVSQVIHTTCSLQHAVNAKSRVVFLHLASFHFGQCVNWRQTRVFCQCQRYTLQCIREGTECILLQGRDLTNANVTCIIYK